MKKKYDEQEQSQKPATNDTTEINATPEKMSEKKETQNLASRGRSKRCSPGKQNYICRQGLKRNEKQKYCRYNKDLSEKNHHGTTKKSCTIGGDSGARIFEYRYIIHERGCAAAICKKSQTLIIGYSDQVFD